MKKYFVILGLLYASAASAQQGPQPPYPWTHRNAMAAEQRMTAAYVAELKALEAKLPDQAATIEAKIQAFREAAHRRFVGQLLGHHPPAEDRNAAAHAVAAFSPDTSDIKAAAQTHGVPFPALNDPETFMRSVK